LPVVADHPRRADVRARLVELEPQNVDAACEAVSERRLDWNVEIVHGDPALTDAYAGAVPADLVVLCGVFGSIDEANARNTIEHLPGLCAGGGSVVWTLEPTDLGRAAPIRASFERTAFRETAFEPARPGGGWVGVNRFEGAVAPLRLGVRLFTFASPPSKEKT
jgi:hypothetical protein